jgi:hypothetical protein
MDDSSVRRSKDWVCPPDTFTAKFAKDSTKGAKDGHVALTGTANYPASSGVASSRLWV